MTKKCGSSASHPADQAQTVSIAGAPAISKESGLSPINRLLNQAKKFCLFSPFSLPIKSKRSGFNSKRPLARFVEFSKYAFQQTSSGFTLVELLVVVAIIGILAGVSIPAYQAYQRSSALRAAQMETKNMGTALLACMADGNNIAACSTNTIKDNWTETCTTASAANNKAPTTITNQCTFNHTSPKTCYGSIKVIGGEVAYACVGYDPATAKLTYTKGSIDIGSTTESEGSCGVDGVCN